MSEENKTETVVTEQAPEAKAETTPTKPTKEENLEAFRKGFLRLVDDKTKDKAEKKPEPEKKKEPEKPEDKKPEKVEAKPDEKKKEPVRKVEKPVRIEGAEDIAEAAKALRDSLKAVKQKEEPKKLERELPKDIAKKIPVLKELEELDPKRFTGIVDKAKEFYGKGGTEDQYKAQWKKENPGKEFNEADEEHEAFYNDNEPVFDDDDLDAAKESIIEKRVLAKAEEKLRPVKADIDADRAKKAAAPKVTQYIDSAVLELTEAVNPGLKGVDPKEWAATDPLATRLLKRTAPKYAPIIQAVAELESGHPFDEKNQSHTAAANALHQIESALTQLPEDKLYIPVEVDGQVVGYQKFATIEKFSKASAEERSKMWTVTGDILAKQIGQQWQKEVSEEYKNISEDTGYKPSGVKKTEPEAKKQDSSKKKEEPENTDESTQSPSVGAHSPTPTSKDTDGNKQKNSFDQFATGFLRRS